MVNWKVKMNLKSKLPYFQNKLLTIDLFSDNSNMQTSIHSIIPDGSDKFFTIDESYCPTIQHDPLNFDDILRQTLWYYVENVKHN